MKLLLLGIVAIIVVGYTAFSLFRPGSVPVFGTNKKIEAIYAEPMRLAKNVYKEKKNQKTDFSQSPCLSEDLGDGYSLDVVNNPRTILDDQNKCQSYQTGKTQHIIEMTPDGEIERIN